MASESACTLLKTASSASSRAASTRRPAWNCSAAPTTCCYSSSSTAGHGQLFDHLSAYIANQIYQGYWLDLGTTAALAALEPINRLVTGTVTVRLYKGNLSFETAEDTPEAMPHSLYTDDSSMEALGSYDHADAEGFLKVLEVSARNVGNRQYPRLGR